MEKSELTPVPSTVDTHGPDSTPQPSAVDVCGKSPERRDYSGTIMDVTRWTGAAICVVAGLGLGKIATSDYDSVEMNPSVIGLKQGIRGLVRDQTPAEIRAVELLETSRITLTLDPKDNRHFSVSGILPEPALMTINSIGNNGLVSMEKPVAQGSFTISSEFEHPVQGYAVGMTRNDGTKLVINPNGSGDMLGQNQIWSRSEAEKRAMSVNEAVLDSH
jgi:hypothetical protein